MTPVESSVQDAIDRLSTKKHMVTPEAVRAQHSLSQVNEDLAMQTKKHLSALTEFDKSIRVLMSVFRESRFEEMVLLLAQPAKLFLLNLLVGVVRGVGFAIGLALVISLAFSIFDGPSLSELFAALGALKS